MTATFRQIKRDVLDKISGGEWAPGHELPTETALAAGYGCARATVNRALRELAEDGILDRKRKSGTRVRMAPLRQARFEIPLTRREIEARGARYGYALVRQRVRKAPEWIRAKMGVDGALPVLHLVALHYADDTAFQLEDRWINLETLPAAAEADFSATGPNEWLVATVPFSEVEIGFAAAGADDAAAHSFGCAPGTALFEVERVTWNAGAPVTFVRLLYAPGYRLMTRY